MSWLVHTGLGIAALFAALEFWVVFARRGGAWRFAAGVAAAAFGINAVRGLYWRLVDTPGGGPTLLVLGALSAALAAGAWQRWRALDVAESGLSPHTGNPPSHGPHSPAEMQESKSSPPPTRSPRDL